MNPGREFFEADVEDHVAEIAKHPEMGFERPPGWVELECTADGMVFGARAFKSPAGLCVIVSVDEVMGKRWFHVSVSRRGRMPDYNDLTITKRTFIGEEQVAYQVFPRRTEHRNFHNYCLHLWAPLDGDPFPDLLGERADRVAP